MKNILLIFVFSFFMYASDYISITGTVISNNQKYIGARYMGYVKKVYFDIGDKVKRDDTLFELESAEFDVLRSQAELALEQSKIVLDMYRERVERIKRRKRWLKRRLKKGEDVIFDINNLDTLADNASAGLAAARALVKSASLKVKQVITLSEYLKVKAPNDGIIVEKRVKVGDLVFPGSLAMILVDLKHLQIQSEIAEQDLFKVKRFQDVDIYIPAIKYKTTGYIQSIVPSANPMAHTFTIRISFKRKSKKVYPGMYAKIKILKRYRPINR